MKYGLDVNDNFILQSLIKVLESKGHFIVNLSTLKDKNVGALLYKKTLIANVTKIDVYLGIETVKSDEESKIYFNEFLKSSEIRRKIINILQKISKKEILEDNTKLYLSKNINSLVIYCRIKIIDDKIVVEKVIKSLIDILDNIL
jgi:hypothetical protein